MREKSRIRGWSAASTSLHEQRLDAVMERLLEPGTTFVVDLGCGSGALLERLVQRRELARIVGVDTSSLALSAAADRLASSTSAADDRVSLRHGSLTEPDADLAGADAVALVETFEHLPAGSLSRLERALFTVLRPRRIVITTPNREYNATYGLEPGEYRHPHHRFEWDRHKFERWMTGAAGRNGYDVVFEGVGPTDALLGSPTQMAVFRKTSVGQPEVDRLQGSAAIQRESSGEKR